MEWEFIWCVGWILWLIVVGFFVVVFCVTKDKSLRFYVCAFLGMFITIVLIVLIVTERVVHEKPAVKSTPAAVKTLP